MPELDRDGVTIYYEWHKSSAADAPCVLLSHGYSASSAMWRGQLDALTRTHHLITWDMRGHGQSASPAEPGAYSEQHCVDDMAALLNTCEVGRAVIGGLSLGGYMTLAFHLAYPDLCGALMLFDTGPGYKSDKGRAAWNATANERADAFDRDGLAALGAGNEVRIALHTSAAGLAHAARGMLAQRNDRVIQSLPSITLPTLVLVGEDDTPFRVPSEYMANKIPNAQHVVLKGAGHAANIDQPDGFNQAVRGFLDGLA